MLTYSVTPHELRFKTPAKTSRNTFASRLIYLVELKDNAHGKTGIGECAPLTLLSIDDVPDYEERLHEYCQLLCEGNALEELELGHFPSIRFGLETALMDLNSPFPNRLFDTAFTRSEAAIPVNGLVWMDNPENMLEEALRKAEEGYSCIKFKVSALDFDAECRMLEAFRRRYHAFKVELRLDANGAFHPDEAREQLKILKRFDIHSIEQPIAVRQWDGLASLISDGLIDIALDEELISLDFDEAEKMLPLIKAHYLVLKPNLLGGLGRTAEWIALGRKTGMEWWVTSALESNVGLNAIAQWLSTYEINMAQGLGTGGLYENNFKSRLHLEKGMMYYL